MIKIEAGCAKQKDGRYRYDYTTVGEGYKTVFFTANNGEVPEIGDFITSQYVLKKREGYQIENEGKLKWPGRDEEDYVQFGRLYEK